MTQKTVQDYLPFIENPSRYLGSEINVIKKDPKAVGLHMALAFPDLYEIGTSHFGIQILYHILNQQDDVFAERVFCPDVDLEKYLRDNELPIVSMETKTPLNQFDMVGFSLLYELNYTNILTMLDLSNIPFYASKRNHTHPIIIGGGPCTFNPEPVADLFDAMVIGDGEVVIRRMAEEWIRWKLSSDKEKGLLYRAWSKIDGVYIPSFFKPRYDKKGRQKLVPRYPDYIHVKKAVIRDLDQAPFPENPIVPFGRPVHDRLRLEISRGCTRGCRFCQAGMIYRPVRERSIQKLHDLARTSLKNTGYEDLSLLSLSTGDYSCIQALMEKLMVEGEREHTAISLPSLRAGTLTPRLMELIKKVRKTGFTIAPEAGSQRLRNVINKNITEEEILDTVKNAFQMGWKVIKLYFMIGLPTEKEKDIDDIIRLVKKIRNIKFSKGRINKINVSVTTFVPKSHTPFEREAQITVTRAQGIISQLKNELKLPGVQVKWQNPQVSLIEGLLARGDRKMSGLLVNAFEKGCKLDGWTDHFNFNLWSKACQETGIDFESYNYRKRSDAETLPWDHINARIDPEFLKKESEKSRSQICTSDCRLDECHQCGVCDFETIQPITQQDNEDEDVKLSAAKKDLLEYQSYTLTYSKTGPARFFGHLELVNIMNRAIKRAGISIKYTEGFHPKPKVSFLDPLPIGMESQKEYMFIFVQKDDNENNLKDLLNEKLPKGLKIHQSRITRKEDKSARFKEQVYMISNEIDLFNEEKLNRFRQRKEMIITQLNKKGNEKKIDLKLYINKIDMKNKNRIKMIIQPTPDQNIRPLVALKAIFDLHEDDLKTSKVVKFDEDSKIKNQGKKNGNGGIN